MPRICKSSPLFLFGAAIIFEGTWRGNLNYWLGGAQGAKGSWGWCAGADFSPLPGANLSWAPGQPELNKSDEKCLHMRVHPNSSKGALLTDRECKSRFILGCQVHIIILCPKMTAKT